MKRKELIALAAGITLVLLVGGLCILLFQTRFMASHKVIVDQSSSCSWQNPYSGQVRVYCVRLTEVQRFFDRGSRVAEYDIDVDSDPSLSTPDPYAYHTMRQNIFSADSGRIDPGRQPVIEWRSDGLLISKSHGVLTSQEKQDPRLKLDPPGQAAGEFFLPASEFVR